MWLHSTARGAEAGLVCTPGPSVMSRRERQRRRKRNSGSPIRRVIVLTAVFSIAGIALGVAGVAGWVVSVADSAPDINQLKPRDQGQVSEVIASDGSLLGYISSDILRVYASDNQIPKVLKNATIAIEDRRFYHHGGIDYQGILRAGVRDVFGGGGAIQGGSTLTMQLVRNIYLPYQLADTRSLKRKIIEAKLAEELEQKHAKNWILTQYLNDVDYGTLGGKTAVGVGAASQLYFDKPAAKLDLAQAALLAGLPQAPSQYNPFLAPDLARARRHEVLRAMLQSHYITAGQAARADASSLQTKRNNAYTLKREPYVFDYVKESLIKRYGLKAVERGGLKVYTTIDLKRQQEARQALLANEGQPGDPAAALVSIDPQTGHILAMATTSSYDQTNFDYATQAHRQTGSAFKVFSLMALIHDFHGDPNQTFYTSKELLPGWLPGYPSYHVQTSEKSYQGTISVAKATTISDNTVFAQLAQDVTLANVSATAHAMGITSPLTGFPSEALGAVSVSPLEMADAYATLASGGVHHDATAISKSRVRRRQRQRHRRHLQPTRIHRRRGLRRHPGAEDGDPERNRDRRGLRLSGSRQDRDDQQLHRRVLRRVHASARHRGVGRLSEVDDLDDRRQRARSGLRRDAGGADLARLHGAGEQRLLRRLPATDHAVQRHNVQRRVLGCAAGPTRQTRRRAAPERAPPPPEPPRRRRLTTTRVCTRIRRSTAPERERETATGTAEPAIGFGNGHQPSSGGAGVKHMVVPEHPRRDPRAPC